MRAPAVGACADGMTGRMRPVTEPHMCGSAGWRMRHPEQHLPEAELARGG